MKDSFIIFELLVFKEIARTKLTSCIDGLPIIPRKAISYCSDKLAWKKIFILETLGCVNAIPHNFTHKLTSLKFLVVWGREENRSTRTKTLKTQERQAESCSYSQPTLATY